MQLPQFEDVKKNALKTILENVQFCLEQGRTDVRIDSSLFHPGVMERFEAELSYSGWRISSMITDIVRQSISIQLKPL